MCRRALKSVKCIRSLLNFSLIENPSLNYVSAKGAISAVCILLQKKYCVLGWYLTGEENA